jgi:5-methylcytosine-specific restriction endonuclease McrA
MSRNETHASSHPRLSPPARRRTVPVAVRQRSGRGTVDVGSTSWCRGPCRVVIQAGARVADVAADTHRRAANYDGRCYYTGLPFTETRPPTLDHIVPLKLGGRNDAANLVWALGNVNMAKGTGTYEELLDLCRAVLRKADRL